MSSSEDDSPLVDALQSWSDDDNDRLPRRRRGRSWSRMKLLGVSFVSVGLVAMLFGGISRHFEAAAVNVHTRKAEAGVEKRQNNPGSNDRVVIHSSIGNHVDDCAAEGRCGYGDPMFSCQCDLLCPQRGDCCNDFFSVCTDHWLTDSGVGELVVGRSAYEYFEDVQPDAQEQLNMLRGSGREGADQRLQDVEVIQDEGSNSSDDDVDDSDYSVVPYCVWDEGGYCNPGFSRPCKPCECCHWDSSCHRCPYGYEVDHQKCNSFSRARCKQKPVQLAKVTPDMLGIVSELYTFGAPATSTEPLTNKQRADGCFPGLRVYTEDRKPANLQVDAAAIFTSYKHAQTNVLVLHWNKPSFFRPCVEDPKPYWPQNGAAVYANWGLHHEPHYGPRLECFYVDHWKERMEEMEDEFSKVHPFARMAYAIYGIEDDYLKPAIEMYLPTWRVVADETIKQRNDEDRVLLVQEQESQSWACLLVFEGTNSFTELFSSLKTHLTSYCGFKNVHSGYRDEIWTLTREIWPRMRNKFSKCSSLAVTGHSLGGAVAELFTACVNSNRTRDPDFKQARWIKGTPGKIPEIQYEQSNRKSDRRREPSTCPGRRLARFQS